MKSVFQSTGISEITKERSEQLVKHGWDEKNNPQYYSQEELRLAAVYCITLEDTFYPPNWKSWFKEKIALKKERMTEIEFRIEMDKIAGALLAADIDFITPTN